MRYKDVTQRIIGAAYEVHNYLGAGFLEKVYETALLQELRALGMEVSTQHPLPVMYKGVKVGDYYADMLINRVLICEIKAVEKLTRQHEAQLVNYLAAGERETGLLINFGSSVTVKRKFLQYQKKSC